MQTYKRRKIHDICNKLWDKYSLQPGFKFSKLLAEMNISYREECFEDDGISAILITKGEKSLITSNSNHHINRKRFSIGHEMGHLLLNHKRELDVKEEEKIFFRNQTSSLGIDSDEVEANYFSACLLMPEEKVKESVNMNISFEENIENLSKLFKVSQAAMTLRLNFLGYYFI